MKSIKTALTLIIALSLLCSMLLPLYGCKGYNKCHPTEEPQTTEIRPTETTKKPPELTRAPSAYPADISYIGNKKSHIYHLSTCSFLPNAENQIILADEEAAIEAGYTPCGHCDP